MEGTRAIGEALGRPPAGPQERRLDGGAVVCQVLAAEGVRHLFTVNGGHIWPILGHLREHGIRMIHMRHEQSCAYAADAYARTTGRPGVLAVTGSPVVCLAGQHPTTEDQLGSFQEAYGSEICRSFAKFVKRTLDWSTIGLDVRMAFREATAPPPGPALVEIPTNVLYHQDDAARQRPGACLYPPGTLRAAADPAAIDRALDALARAERPLVVAGDGVFWSDAAAELRALAQTLALPVYTRRAVQGALPEDDSLAVRGAWKEPFTSRADVILAVGFKFGSGEHFGQPPTWNAAATVIQVDATPARIGWHVDAAIPILGDPKLVLAQLLRRAAELGIDGAHRRESTWLAEITAARERFEARLRAEEARVQAAVPIHPAPVVRALVETLAADATVIVDSFTLSGWLSQRLVARFPGQVVDAGPLAPVGHGI